MLRIELLNRDFLTENRQNVTLQCEKVTYWLYNMNKKLLFRTTAGNITFILTNFNSSAIKLLYRSVVVPISNVFALQREILGVIFRQNLIKIISLEKK